MSDRGLLTKRERAAAQKALAELRAVAGSDAAVGALIDVSQGAVHKGRVHGQVGPAVARAIQEYMKLPVADFLEKYAPEPDAIHARTVERDPRYHVESLVKQAAESNGDDPEFVAAWEMRLDSDVQPTFDEAKAIYDGEYARWKLLRRGRAPLGERKVGREDV